MTLEMQLMTLGDKGHRKMSDALTPDNMVERLKEIDVAHGEWLWLDITSSIEPIQDQLTEYFGFDRITLGDLLEKQSPHYEEHDHGTTVAVQALALDTKKIRTTEVDLIVGDGWLLTVHDEVIASIDIVQQRAMSSKFVAEDPFHLAARLIEFIAERYLPVLDLIDDQLFDLEDAAIAGDPTMLANLHALRRDIAVLRRSLGPQRRMLEMLQSHLRTQTGQTGRELADAVDHHARLIDTMDGAHSVIAGLVDTYRSATGERMNEVMKTLTVFTAVIGPLTLISGIYGMNFRYMPELNARYGYPLTLMAMLIIVVIECYFFVRLGYIGRRKHSKTLQADDGSPIDIGLAKAAAMPVQSVDGKVTTSKVPRADGDPPAFDR